MFSEIESAVLDGRFDAGVIIHENRFTYEAKGLEKVVVPGAGHFVHVERPADVNRRIVKFFQTR